MDSSFVKPQNYYGNLKLPGLNISLELFILILYPSFLIPASYLWFTYLRKTKNAATSPAGCRKLGLRGPSNMKDEYDSKYDQGTDDSDQWKVKALFIYPIKSCAPIELDELEIEAAGPVWDRRFCFAEYLPPRSTKANATKEEKKPQWTFRTLRQPGYEKLALVKPEIWAPERTPSKDKSMTRQIERSGALIIKYPNIPSGPLAFLDRLMMRWGLIPLENSFQVPLLHANDLKYSKEQVKLWNDLPNWHDYGEYIPDDFRQFIGAPNRISLFRANPEDYREVSDDALKEEGLGYQSVIGAADAYPMNLLNLASIHEVGNRLRESIPHFSARRFRCNILVAGPKAYDEDSWKRLKVISSTAAEGEGIHNGDEIYCACLCTRCRLPNVDPDTAERHPSEPDKTLRNYRCVDEENPKSACMGLQLVPARSEGMRIKVGDKIQVLERKITSA